MRLTYRPLDRELPSVEILELKRVSEAKEK